MPIRERAHAHRHGRVHLQAHAQLAEEAAAQAHELKILQELIPNYEKELQRLRLELLGKGDHSAHDRGALNWNRSGSLNFNDRSQSNSLSRNHSKPGERGEFTLPVFTKTNTAPLVSTPRGAVEPPPPSAGMLARMYSTERARAIDVFRSLDVDGDHKISRREIHGMLSAAGMQDDEINQVRSSRCSSVSAQP